MEDGYEHDFGDLYTDFVRLSSSTPPSQPIPCSTSTYSPNITLIKEHDRNAPFPSSTEMLASSPSLSIPQHRMQIGIIQDQEHPDGDAKVVDSNHHGKDGNTNPGVSDLPKTFSFGGVKEEGMGLGAADGGIMVREEEAEVDLLFSRTSSKFEVGGIHKETFIPGLSTGPGVEPSTSEDWDSDSGDELQILVNDDSLERRGSHGNEAVGGDDDNLFIVNDKEQLHHHHQGAEEKEWGGDSMQPVLDGEKMELFEATKGRAGVSASVSGRIGYSVRGFHQQHHSQFKYIRPGAASGHGVPTGGQISLFSMGPNAGRGRSVQRGFNPGYGAPLWGNNTSAKPFGIGLEFTLPSHKTIFDVDIDAFEEKPWRLAGIEKSDFFNFELDEDKWKEYRKQLEQLCLESTMQSKIHVYESGRSVQDYDPDLPPELAAANHQDISSENTHVRKVDGQSDLLGQQRGANWMHPQFPTGQAIHVETGTVERFPTSDTRQARPRCSDDSIIEIVLQGSLDDPEKPGNGVVGDDYVEEYKCRDDIRNDDSKSSDRSPQTKDGMQEIVTTRSLSVHDAVSGGEGILPFPPEASILCSKMRDSLLSVDHSGRPYTGRQVAGAPREIYSGASDEYTNDVLSSQNALRVANGKMQKLDDNVEANDILEIPSASPNESSIENRDNGHDDRLYLVDGTEEREGMHSDLQNSGDTLEDSKSSYSPKKEKLNSKIKQSIDLDGIDKGKSRTMHVDNIRAKSVSTSYYVKEGESCKDNNMQDSRARMLVDLKRHYDNSENGFQQRDRYGRASRHDLDRSHVTKKGKETSHQINHRQFDPSLTYHALEVNGHVESKGMGVSSGFWHKKDGDIHGRRLKDGEFQVRSEEMGSRHIRNKLRVSVSIGGGEDVPLKKQPEEGYWRSCHDRDGGLKQREEGGNLISRHENHDDMHANRRKDKDHRTEKVTKEILNGHMSRDDIGQNKKERVDHRRNENLVRARDKIGDHHFTGHKDEGRWYREREDRKQSKQVYADTRECRERDEGEGVVAWDSRSISEHKLYNGNERVKDGANGFNSDKESMLRKKGYHEIHAHESQLSNEIKGRRNGRASSHGNHSLHASDRQNINRERHRSSTKRIEQEKKNSTGKRKREDKHQREKINKRTI